MRLDFCFLLIIVVLIYPCAEHRSTALLCARLQRVAHTGRHFTVGVTYSSIGNRTIARRVSLTDALLDQILLDLVLI